MDSLDYTKYELQLPNAALITICFVDLHKCNGYKLSNCYCSKTESKDVFDVTINFTGLPSYSESFLRGKLIFFDGNIYSEAIILPKIYDRVKPNTKLYINDKIVKLETCEESINGNDVNFVFFLDHDQAYTDSLPCRLEIADGLNNTLKNTELVTLSYTAKVYSSETFFLSYEFCGSHKNKGSFVCNIKAEQPDVSLVINNKDVNIKNCEETVNSSEVNFLFSVQDSERRIKRLTLMGDATGETIENNSDILTHSASIQGNRVFIFKYELVGLDVKSFYCSIQTGKEKSVQLTTDLADLDENNTRFIVPLALSIIFNVTLLVVCCLLVLKKYSAKKKKPDLKNEQCLMIEEIVLLEKESTSPCLSQSACSNECEKIDFGSEHNENLSLSDGSSSVVHELVESDLTFDTKKKLEKDYNVKFKPPA